MTTGNACSGHFISRKLSLNPPFGRGNAVEVPTKAFGEGTFESSCSAYLLTCQRYHLLRHLPTLSTLPTLPYLHYLHSSHPIHWK